jgi:type III secretory pathway lipoprotein EscJ
VHSNPGLWIAAAVAISAACAPLVDGPIDHQRALDREDSDRLTAQLTQLPGVVAASVALHHATRDPLAVTGPSPATFSAVIAVDDQAAPDAIRAATTRLAHAALPELPAGSTLPIEVNVVVHRPTMAKVGPFSVEDSSRGPLKLTLVLACLAIAALAGVVARNVRRHRLGNSAQ